MNYEIHLKSGTVAKFKSTAYIKSKNSSGFDTLVFYSKPEILSADKKSVKISCLDQADAIFANDMIVGLIQIP